MAAQPNKGIKDEGQASGLGAGGDNVASLDEMGFPLIPYDRLPFASYRTRGGRRHFDSHWRVDVPDDANDARHLGQELALAFLRMAPIDSSGRQHSMEWMTLFILSAQADALKEGGNARMVVAGFWQTIARFAEPAATLANVEGWRGYCAERRAIEGAAMEAWRAEDDKAASERAQQRRAANARWAKHRKPAKRGRS